MSYAYATVMFCKRRVFSHQIRVRVRFLNFNFLAAKNQDDMLAVFAKEEGQKLHRDLPERERRNTIEQTISKIETEIDVEVTRKKQLEVDLRTASPAGQPTQKSSAVEINLKKCKGQSTAKQP